MLLVAVLNKTHHRLGTISGGFLGQWQLYSFMYIKHYWCGKFLRQLRFDFCDWMWFAAAVCILGSVIKKVDHGNLVLNCTKHQGRTTHSCLPATYGNCVCVPSPGEVYCAQLDVQPLLLNSVSENLIHNIS